MKTLRALWTTVCLATLTLHAQAVARPKITAIARVGYFVSDRAAALQFWHGLLGFETLAPQTNSRTTIEINPHQHIDLITGPLADPPSHMSGITFAVSNIPQMRAYLHSQGVEATLSGNTLDVNDPEGTHVHFVQATAARNVTHSPADKRISTAIFHAGFAVRYLDQTMDFYHRILGFTETWRGSADNKTLSWINMKLPDSDDYIEFMLGASNDAKSLGGKNHLSLSVPDMDKATAEIKLRATAVGYTRPIEIHTGINRKRQLNLFDPDGTRIELMEPFTIDGKPATSSTAPPPSAP